MAWGHRPHGHHGRGRLDPSESRRDGAGHRAHRRVPPARHRRLPAPSGMGAAGRNLLSTIETSFPLQEIAMVRYRILVAASCLLWLAQGVCAAEPAVLVASGTVVKANPNLVILRPRLPDGKFGP